MSISSVDTFGNKYNGRVAGGREGAQGGSLTQADEDKAMRKEAIQ